MNVIVCVKQTFDTEETIRIENGVVVEDGVKFVMNPYDEYALEEAIRIKEAEQGRVTVITVGPDRAETMLRTALAMGADEAIIINDEQCSGDEWTTSCALAAAIRSKPFDLVLCGYMAVDSGAGQGGARLAELLDIPHISAVTSLDIEGSKVTAESDVEGGTETIGATLPVLITAQQGLNEPRYPTLPGMMKAKKKTIDRLPAADLGLAPDQLRAKTAITEQYTAAKQRVMRKLEGDVAEQAGALVGILMHDAKVISGGEPK